MPRGGDRQIRISGLGRIAMPAGRSLRDAAEILEGITRVNVRGFRDDPALRDEVIRRVLSPPCATRCYVSRDGTQNDCNCASGFQWTTDSEAQALEGCGPVDIWNDFASLGAAHHAAGRGMSDPIAADCDCLTPIALGAMAYLAWFQPENFSVAGFSLGAQRNDSRRFAVGITLPPAVPGKERIGHAYALTNYIPGPPQPKIRMPYKDPWFVWDPSAHWGMKRPEDSFYPSGEHVAFEVRREHLDGLE